MSSPKPRKRGSAAQAEREELAMAQLELESAHRELQAVYEETRRADLELHVRQEIAAGVLDALAVPTLVLAHASRILETNRSFLELFQLERAEVVGRELRDLGGRDWSWKQIDGILQVASSTPGEVIGREVEGNFGQLRRRTFRLGVRPLSVPPGPNGTHPQLLVCSLEDVTVHKQAQQLLEAQLDHLGGISAGLAILDNQGRVRYANAALESLTGRRAAELLHRRFDPLPGAQESLGQGQRASGQDTLPRPDGTRLPVRWTAVPIADGGLIELRDLSQEQQLVQSLLESEKLAATGRLAATLAHEINNPLGVVSNALFLLREAGLADARAQRLADTAAAEIQRIGQIVRSTLSLYRSQAVLETVDPNSALSNVLELLTAVIGKKHLGVQRRLLSTQRLEMVGGELRQMLVNLLDNACAALPEGGQLFVASHDMTVGGEPGVRLLIGDSGPGIAAEVRPRLFRPFATTKGAHGTGLGLFVVAELARKYGAEVRCKSWPAAGGRSGTCFALTLPMRPNSAAAPAFPAVGAATLSAASPPPSASTPAAYHPAPSRAA